MNGNQFDEKAVEPRDGLKVAIVHYWLINWRGGEKVIEALLELYPQADIYTHVYDEASTEGRLKGRNIKTTFISKLPNPNHWYKKYLPLMPFALSQLDLTSYDLVISSESGPAKSVITHPDALHVCYCHSPLRYAWDMYYDYMATLPKLMRPLMRVAMHYMRAWDQISSSRPDVMLANSSFIKRRIAKSYRRAATVVHPPVDLDEFSPSHEKKDFFLVFGQLTAYKKADLVVKACIASGHALVVVGGGEQLDMLRDLAEGHDHIKILGRRPWQECKAYLQQARALVFPGVEDFGIVPVEALASGTPVIALAKGGALDTVQHGYNGLLYEDASEHGVISAIEAFIALEPQLSIENITASAEQFNKPRFQHEFLSIVAKAQQALKNGEFLH